MTAAGTTGSAEAGKVYRGDRTIDGVIVRIGDAPLAERYEVRRFTDRGFEWSYEGDGPRQLALALLLDHLGDREAALAACERFMTRVVANFGNEWEMTGRDIDLALGNIRAEA